MSTAALLAAPRCRPHRPLDLQVSGLASISACGTYRWSLQRWWHNGALGSGAILPWIMLNPSKADAHVDDPTLKRIIAFSWRWGFDGLLVVNLFPYRSSKPSELRNWWRWDERQDWHARDQFRAGQSMAAALLAPFDAAMAAWGSPPGPLHYDAQLAAERLLDAVDDPDRTSVWPPRSAVLKLFCLGETGAGDPTHPMARGRHRVPDDAVPLPLRRYPGTIVGLGDEVAAA